MVENSVSQPTAQLLFRTNPSMRRPLLAFCCACIGVIIIYQLLEYLLGPSLLLTEIIVLLSIFPVVILIRNVILHSYFMIYSIFDDHIEKQSGIIAREIVRANHERIINFVMKQSMIQRLVGVCDILVSTAGTSLYEFKFSDVTVLEGSRILDLIKQVSKSSQNPGGLIS